MSCPLRSLPFAGNRNSPSSAPGGMVGSVTFDSPVLGPDGMADRSQISTSAVPPSVTILAPDLLRATRIGAGVSAGGSPAGCDLNCANTAVAVRRKEQKRVIIFILVLECQHGVQRRAGNVSADFAESRSA